MIVSWRPFGVAVICVLPFIILNTLVAMPVPAFVAWLRPDGHTSALEWFLLWGSIGAIFVGGLVVLSAVWQQRRFVFLNILLGVVLFSVGTALASVLGAEMVVCEWQHVPNCD